MTTPRPQPGPDSCSARTRAAGEELPGTAPVRTAWVLIEQYGPWGPRPLEADTPLPDAIASELRRFDGTRVGAMLIRRPERHATAPTATRCVLVASVHPQRRWMHRYELEDSDVVRLLRDLDPEMLAGGHLPPTRGTPAGPVLAVCAHARRDLCCAVLGRAVLADLHEAAPRSGVDLWECSHLGGHRFAPTALVLPSGLMLGRADAADCLAAAAGGWPSGAVRGHTWRSPLEQVAEAAVLENGTDADRAAAVAQPWTVGAHADVAAVVAPDGRRWQVPVTAHHLAPRPTSCGKADDVGTALKAGTPTPAP